jgi:hypothetical protein
MAGFNRRQRIANLRGCIAGFENGLPKHFGSRDGIKRKQQLAIFAFEMQVRAFEKFLAIQLRDTDFANVVQIDLPDKRVSE